MYYNQLTLTLHVHVCVTLNINPNLAHNFTQNLWAHRLIKHIFLEKVHVAKIRASDKVRQKMGNSTAFSREIMRQERSIMQQIMRFF